MKVWGKIRIAPLKKFVNKNLPYSFVTRYIVENEEDVLSCEEFLAKMDVWLKALRWDLYNQDKE